MAGAGAMAASYRMYWSRPGRASPCSKGYAVYRRRLAPMALQVAVPV